MSEENGQNGHAPLVSQKDAEPASTPVMQGVRLPKGHKPRAFRMGPPSKLTETVRDTIIASLYAGNALRNAFILAGVSEAIGFRWLKRGRALLTERNDAVDAGRGEPLYNIEQIALIDLVECIDGALAIMQHTFAKVVTDKAKADPDYALKLLRTRWRDDWGEQQDSNVNVNVTTAVQIVEAPPRPAHMREAEAAHALMRPDPLAKARQVVDATIGVGRRLAIEGVIDEAASEVRGILEAEPPPQEEEYVSEDN